MQEINQLIEEMKEKKKLQDTEKVARGILSQLGEENVADTLMLCQTTLMMLQQKAQQEFKEEEMKFLSRKLSTLKTVEQVGKSPFREQLRKILKKLEEEESIESSIQVFKKALDIITNQQLKQAKHQKLADYI